MIRLLRVAFAAWAVVCALQAAALAAAELHPLEAQAEGGSKQVEDQFINFLGGFFGRPAGSEESCCAAPTQSAPAPRPMSRSSMSKLMLTCPTNSRWASSQDHEHSTPGCASPMAWARYRTPAKVSTTKYSRCPRNGHSNKDVDGQRQDSSQNSPIFPIWPLQGFALTVQLGIAKAQGRTRSSWGNLS